MKKWISSVGMNIVVSSTSELPIYQQIYDQISRMIVCGELPNNYCLPAIRTVAKELRISVITIKRAWEELERDGFIYTKAGKGCFVANHAPEKLSDKRETMALEKMVKDVEYYKGLGLSAEDIIELVKEAY
ncbi:MAG: GntR family transcriptional regulator [Candidatus Izemoplasmatales bacterium]|nr:GntR family transcriptional regulator [Candidatus Izemoplasmatales bacterium]